VTDLDVAGGVTTVRFDNPPVNALDLDVLDTVVATMRRIDGPVVVAGAGKYFSAGVDLQAIVDGGSDYTDRFVTALSEAFLAVFDHPAPVVAPINGHAVAGGCVFAMCADCASCPSPRSASPIVGAVFLAAVATLLPLDGMGDNGFQSSRMAGRTPARATDPAPCPIGAEISYRSSTIRRAAST
jgi:Enoyl-CoA hydratase/isomerase